MQVKKKVIGSVTCGGCKKLNLRAQHSASPYVESFRGRGGGDRDVEETRNPENGTASSAGFGTSERGRLPDRPTDPRHFILAGHKTPKTKQSDFLIPTYASKLGRVDDFLCDRGHVT